MDGNGRRFDSYSVADEDLCGRNVFHYHPFKLLRDCSISALTPFVCRSNEPLPDYTFVWYIYVCVHDLCVYMHEVCVCVVCGVCVCVCVCAHVCMHWYQLCVCIFYNEAREAERDELSCEPTSSTLLV